MNPSVIGLIIAGVVAILEILNETFIKDGWSTKKKNLIRLTAVLLIIGGCCFSIVGIWNDNKENNKRYNNTIDRMDSILMKNKEVIDENKEINQKTDTILKKADLTIKQLIAQTITNYKQAEVENKNQQLNIFQLKTIIADLQEKRKLDEVHFAKTLDSLAKAVEKISDISDDLEMQKYPLTPIKIKLQAIFKYNTFPFGRASHFLHDDSFDEWFTYDNKYQETINYGFFGLPKFVNESEAIDNFIHPFSININVLEDTIPILTYPSLEGKYTVVRDGIVFIGIVSNAEYKITIYHSKKSKELIFVILYTIRSLNAAENVNNLYSLKEIEAYPIKIHYEFLCPLSKKLVIFEETHYNKGVNDTLKMDIDRIYLGSIVEIECGENFSEIKKMKKIPNSDYSSTNEIWWKCGGAYRFE